MNLFTPHSTHMLLVAALLSGAALSPVWAADEPAPTGAASATGAARAPAPNPAAEKALGQHFQTIFSAFEGKGALPDTKAFTEDFNQQTNTEHMKQVFQQVRQSVGACRIAGKMQSPSPYIGSYLLQCDKAFVPMDIAIEEKAPYRIGSLLIRPGYWKP